ncbi:hypothetical protein V6N13_026208 [Hibiscus sabdariffa]|uniref:Uncharacterized protein n=1 Tax=Hibiscus sabdariffa TaxID=183260 RepID=A0ABR2P5M2_9ROSI
MDLAMPPWLDYCSVDPVRFSSPRSNRVSIHKRTRPVRAIAIEPKPTGNAWSQSSPPPKNNINGSSKSSSSKKSMNERMGEVSQEIKRVRAQMEENEELAILMRGLREQNLRDS